MGNNLSLARLITWLTAFVLGSLLTAATGMFFADQDRWGPEGITAGFTVLELPHDTSRETVIGQIDQSAAELDLNIYRLAPSANGAERATDYYAFIGNSRSVIGDLASGKFPTFGTSYNARLLPADELTRDQLVGMFAVQGDSQNAAVIAAELSNLGLVVRPFTSPPGYLTWPFFLLGSPWGVAVVALWITLVLTLVNLAVTRLAIAAHCRATGISPWLWVSKEVLAMCAPAAFAATLPAAILITYSLAAADGYQAIPVLIVSMVQTAVLLGSALFAMAITWIISRNITLGRLITGARPTRILSILSAIAIVAASLGTGASAGSATRQIISEEHAKFADDYRASQPTLVQASLGHAITSEEAPDLLDALGASYVDLESKNGVLLTETNPLGQFTADPNTATQASGGHSPPNILANTAFLLSLPNIDQELINSISERSSDPNSVTVLLPTSRAEERDQLLSTIRQWLEFQTSLNEGGQPSIPNILVIDDIDLGVVPLLDYNDPPGTMHLIDPVTIVIDAKSGILPHRFYAGLGAYTDGNQFRQAVNERGAGRAVVATNSIPELSALARVDRLAELRITLTGVVVLILTLFIGAAILAAVHFARNRTAIFLLVTTGAPPWKIHGFFLFRILLLAGIPATCGVALIRPPLLIAVVITMFISCVVLLVAYSSLTLLQRNITCSALEIT